MGFELEAPTGEQFSGDMSYNGWIEETYSMGEDGEDPFRYTGTWELTIICGVCGDDYSRFGLRSTPDTQCSYTVTVSFSYSSEG